MTSAEHERLLALLLEWEAARPSGRREGAALAAIEAHVDAMAGAQSATPRWEQLRAFVVERLAGLDGLVRYERPAYDAILVEMDRLAAVPGERVAHDETHDCSCKNTCPLCGGKGPEGEWFEGSEVKCVDCGAVLVVDKTSDCGGRSWFSRAYDEDEPAPTTNEGSEK